MTLRRDAPWGAQPNPALLPPPVPLPSRGRKPLLAGAGIVLMLAVAGASYFMWGRAGGLGQVDAFGVETALGGTPTRVESPPPSAGFLPASISVASDPAGATVFLDFDSIGVTPLYQHRLEPGVYILSLQKPDGASMDSVIFVKEGTSTFDFAFGAQAAAGRRETPPEYAVRPAGLERNAAIIPDAPLNPPAEQRPAVSRSSNASAGLLLVTSEPSGAMVYLDDTVAGETPLVIQDVTPGLHALTIRRDGFEPHAEIVTVEAGSTAKAVVQLKASGGTLSVLVHPWGSIYIDGRLHRQDSDVLYRTQLPVGEHHVRVVHPTLGTWERTVRISGGAEQQLAVHFQEGQGPATATAAAETPAAPAQTEETEAPAIPRDGNGIFLWAEEPPQYAGELADLYRLAEYPRLAYERGVEGKVFLRFMVDEQGRVRYEEVTRGLGLGCDEEALRLIRLARFTPGKIGGQPVSSWHSMYISFEIRE